MAEILMPQLGETVTEGTITKWFKQVGDPIAQDEVLFEVSTDKVDSEVPSTATGFLTEIRVPEGETVDVGVVLAVIGDQAGGDGGGGGEAAAPAEPEAQPEPAAAAPEPEPAPAPAPEAAQTSAEEPAQSAAREMAEPAPEPVEPEAWASAPAGGGEAKLLSPIVRRLVNENNLDVDQIVGTGPGGRITRDDVDKALDGGAGRKPAPAPAAPAAPAAQPAAAAPAAPRPQAPAPAPVAARGDSTQPLNRIRTLTGKLMSDSKHVAPHVLTAMEVDFEGVERVRRQLREGWKAEEGFSLTYLPFIARAVSDALRQFPHLNASLGDGELILHGELNLAIAVDLDFDGLVAPVVRSADSKRLRAIAREISDLAGRARSRQLRPDDISGGTFTITNPGQYGTLMQFPIINQPQVAILSTDGVKRKPVVVTDAQGGESIAIHSVGVLALAWDHRAFDGAYAAAFLAALRDIIETRDWSIEIQ